MITSTINILGARDCRYTLDGVNLAHMRRADLFRMARCFDLGNPDASKNELLTGLIAKLNLMGAESELADMIEG